MSSLRALHHLHPALRTSPRMRRTFTSSQTLRDSGAKVDSLPATFKRVTIAGASVGWIVAGLMYFYSPSTVHTAQGQATREGFLKGWDEKRRKEGDLSVEETDEMRKEEEKYRKSHPDQGKGNVLR